MTGEPLNKECWWAGMDPEQPWGSHLYLKEPEEAILRLEFRSFTGCLVNNWASQVVLVVKNLPAKTGDIRDAVSIPGSGRSTGGGYGNPFQYSRLENPMNRGDWQATVHRATQSWTPLKQLSTPACI